MRQALNANSPQRAFPQALYPVAKTAGTAMGRIRCGWEPLRSQLLLQWNRLNARELDEAGPYRGRIAQLIQRKYGITAELVENYLRNFERTLPVV